MRVLSLASTPAVLLGAVGCFVDPLVGSEIGDTEPDDTGPGETETRGDGDGGSGDGDGDPGDGDGEPHTGDGDGDGEPAENVVLDLFTEACGPTAKWASVGTLMAQPVPIPCDMVGMQATGWMVRYVNLVMSEGRFPKVIALVTSQATGWQIRGTYNVEDVPAHETLEFRADVLLNCLGDDVDCVGYFALGIAEDVPNGLSAKSQDVQLVSGMQPINVTVPLSSLATFTEASIVLIAERTEPGLDPSPEVLIINPRLVQP